jgi:hypothetical protein
VLGGRVTVCAARLLGPNFISAMES